MPPKKKNDKKDATKDSAQASSATQPASEQPTDEQDEDSQINHEQIINDFTCSSTIALQSLSDIYDIAMERIGLAHIEKNLDNFAAGAACEAITDLADWLYLSCEDAATLTDWQTMAEPSCVGIDSWAECAAGEEQVQFMKVKTEEVVDLFCKQKNVGERGGLVHTAILPEWLKVSVRPQSSIAPTTISTTPSVKLQKKSKQRTRSTLSKASNQCSEVQQPSQPVQPTPMVKKLSAGRMRQFKRRSEQHKAQKEKQNSGSSLKTKQMIPNKPRLEPIQKQNPTPMVQIVDPNVVAFEARRRALKTGKIRPQTESETVFVRGGATATSLRKHSTSPKKQSLPIQRIKSKSNQSILPSVPSDSSNNTKVLSHPGALPETLVDSLAIADGRNSQQVNSGANLVDEFETLKPVSITSN